MTKIVAVVLRPYRPPEHFLAGELRLEPGEWVVVPQEHGIEVGEVLSAPLEVAMEEEPALPSVLRLASTEEMEQYFENLEKEKEAWRFCEERARHYGLNMKLVRVERQFEGGKITFFYFAENRVDFRELVKDLVRGLRTRVEMRQIGVRHEAKMIGGIGCCGREVCCTSFLKEFAPVSIKMAKVQNLPLNPNKISGICGRLLCCLTYEYETYKDLKAGLPSLGKEVELNRGEGRVVRQNILKGTVTVVLPDGDEVELPIGEDGEVMEEVVVEAGEEVLAPEDLTPHEKPLETEEEQGNEGDVKGVEKSESQPGRGKKRPKKGRKKGKTRTKKGGREKNRRQQQQKNKKRDKNKR